MITWPTGWRAVPLAFVIRWRVFLGFFVWVCVWSALVIALANHVGNLHHQINELQRERDACRAH